MVQNCLIAWDNAFLGGSLVAGSEAAGLAVTQLQNEQGSPATAWQTLAGATTAATGARLRLDAGATRSWRVLLLARTNLTAAATLRWQLGAYPLLGLVSLPVDSNAGATKGTNTTRAGTGTAPDGAASVTYNNVSTSLSYVCATTPVVAGATYRVTLRAYRATGSGTVGNLISIPYSTDGVTLGPRVNVPMTALAASGVADYTATFSSALTSAAHPIYFFDSTGSVGVVGLVSASIEQVATYDSGMIAAGVAPGFGQAVHVMPQAVSARYARLELNDAANPDNCINIPLAFAAPAWQPARNFGMATALAPEVVADVVTTRGGQEFVNPRYRRRGLQLELPIVGAAELWPNLEAMLRTAATGSNVAVIPNPESADLAREALLGRVTDAGAVPYAGGAGRWRRWSGRIAERL